MMHRDKYTFTNGCTWSNINVWPNLLFLTLTGTVVWNNFILNDKFVVVKSKYSVDFTLCVLKVEPLIPQLMWHTSLVPRRRRGRRKNAWYALFVHALKHHVISWGTCSYVYVHILVSIVVKLGACVNSINQMFFFSSLLCMGMRLMTNMLSYVCIQICLHACWGNTCINLCCIVHLLLTISCSCFCVHIVCI